LGLWFVGGGTGKDHELLLGQFAMSEDPWKGPHYSLRFKAARDDSRIVASRKLSAAVWSHRY
jgi:hypothetical protein